MPTLRYASAAVENLRSWLSTNYPTYLTTINTEEGTSLAAPDVYRGAIHPFAHEKVALEVECNSFFPEDQVNDVWMSDCLVHVVIRGKDADVVQLQKDLRIYASALVRGLDANPTLGDKVVDAQIGTTDFSAVGEEGQLMGVLSTQVTIMGHEP